MAEYIFPTDLPVSSPYGPRAGGFHPGVDFSDGVAGHPIHAVADGVVTYKAYEDGGAGNTVTLTHADGLKSGYMHMQAPAIVGQGERVTQGQVLGYVGTTGASTGPHLHLWMGAGPNPPLSFDPMTVLGSRTPPVPPPVLSGAPDMIYQANDNGKTLYFREAQGYLVLMPNEVAGCFYGKVPVIDLGGILAVLAWNNSTKAQVAKASA